MLSKLTLALALAVSFAVTASAQQHIPGSLEAWNGLVWDPPGTQGRPKISGNLPRPFTPEGIAAANSRTARPRNAQEAADPWTASQAASHVQPNQRCHVG
jgi:hypothetical protein